VGRPPEHHPPRDCFAALLRALYVACGRPRPKWMADEAEEVRRDYPELANVPPPGFSKSTISMVLNGRRGMLPDPFWVTYFVLCCQRLGHASGRLAADPGRKTLYGWQATLIELEDKARRLGLPVRDEHVVPPEFLPSDLRAQASPAPASSVGMTGPIRLPDDAGEHLASYGAHGRSLQVEMMARDPDAVYQSALLLAAAPEHIGTALSLLMSAGAAGHADALDLLQTSSRNLDREKAAAHARRRADQARRSAAAAATEARRSAAAAAAEAFDACVARIENGDPASHPTAPDTP
jgi:hypothetical protein